MLRLQRKRKTVYFTLIFSVMVFNKVCADVANSDANFKILHFCVKIDITKILFFIKIVCVGGHGHFMRKDSLKDR